jgi:hypothetical protein
MREATMAARRRSGRKQNKIRINPRNKGKFTAAAKRNGMGVQAYARKVLAAPKGRYSATLRRRAAFAKGIGGASRRRGRRK